MNLRFSFLKLAGLLLLVTFVTDGWALYMSSINPSASKNCGNTVRQLEPFEDLVHKITIKDDESRVYEENNKFNRSTMRLYCGRGKDTQLLGSLNLIHNGTRYLLSSHSITTEDCSGFRNLKGCYGLDTVDGKQKFRTIKLDNAEIIGKPNCITGPESAETDLAELRLKSSPQGLIPYTVGKGSELREGSKIKVVASASTNFGAVNTDFRRVIQKECRVLNVQKNVLRTDCDSGPGSSGAVALNESGEVVGILVGSVSGHNLIDHLPADGYNNYTSFVVVDRTYQDVVN